MEHLRLHPTLGHPMVSKGWVVCTQLGQTRHLYYSRTSGGISPLEVQFSYLEELHLSILLCLPPFFPPSPFP